MYKRKIIIPLDELEKLTKANPKQKVILKYGQTTIQKVETAPIVSKIQKGRPENPIVIIPHSEEMKLIILIKKRFKTQITEEELITRSKVDKIKRVLSNIENSTNCVKKLCSFINK